MSDQTHEELAAEVETLRKLKSELHSNLTKARARVKELETAESTTLAEVERLNAEVLNLKLHKPVESLLDQILVGSKYSALELADHYKFALNEAGDIEMQHIDGSKISVKENGESRPLRFESADIRRHLEDTGKFNHIIRASGACGGGAPHEKSLPQFTGTKPKAPAERSSFGLR